MMHRQHGQDGVRYAEVAIARRAERSGGTWNRALTRSWCERVVALSQPELATFADVVASGPGVLDPTGRAGEEAGRLAAC